MTTPPNAGEPVAQDWLPYSFEMAVYLAERAGSIIGDGSDECGGTTGLVESNLAFFIQRFMEQNPPTDPYPWLARGAIPPREPPRPG